MARRYGLLILKELLVLMDRYLGRILLILFAYVTFCQWSVDRAEAGDRCTLKRRLSFPKKTEVELNKFQRFTYWELKLELAKTFLPYKVNPDGTAVSPPQANPRYQALLAIVGECQAEAKNWRRTEYVTFVQEYETQFARCSSLGRAEDCDLAREALGDAQTAVENIRQILTDCEDRYYRAVNPPGSGYQDGRNYLNDIVAGLLLFDENTEELKVRMRELERLNNPKFCPNRVIDELPKYHTNLQLPDPPDIRLDLIPSFAPTKRKRRKARARIEALARVGSAAITRVSPVCRLMEGAVDEHSSVIADYNSVGAEIGAEIDRIEAQKDTRLAECASQLPGLESEIAALNAELLVERALCQADPFENVANCQREDELFEQLTELNGRYFQLDLVCPISLGGGTNAFLGSMRSGLKGEISSQAIDLNHYVVSLLQKDIRNCAFLGRFEATIRNAISSIRQSR